MAEYQCFFFGPPLASAEGCAFCHAAETFQADTDELARISADSLCRGRNNLARGFELWQASRLVYRHAATFGESPASRKPPCQEGEATDER